MFTTIANVDERKLETLFERVIVRVLRRQKYDLDIGKELRWLQESEEALKNGKRYTKAKKLIADSLAR